MNLVVIGVYSIKPKLAAPQMITPASQDGNLYGDPSNILFQWTAVENATQYKVNIKDVTDLSEADRWTDNAGNNFALNGYLFFTGKAIHKTDWAKPVWWEKEEKTAGTENTCTYGGNLLGYGTETNNWFDGPNQDPNWKPDDWLKAINPNSKPED